MRKDLSRDAGYSDTTIVIPVKDEPAVWNVAKGVATSLPGSTIIIIYKSASGRLGYGKRGMSFERGRLILVRQRDNGKGLACIRAARMVKTPIMCLIDGDATYEPDDLKAMVGQVRKGVDMVLGNRLANVELEAMPRFIQTGNGILTATANLLYGMDIKDSQTGIRAIRLSSWRKMALSEKNFGIESEMNIKARKRGLKVLEIPVHYYLRVGTTKQRKVVDGIKLFLMTFKFLFS